MGRIYFSFVGTVRRSTLFFSFLRIQKNIYQSNIHRGGPALFFVPSWQVEWATRTTPVPVVNADRCKNLTYSKKRNRQFLLVYNVRKQPHTHNSYVVTSLHCRCHVCDPPLSFVDCNDVCGVSHVPAPCCRWCS